MQLFTLSTLALVLSTPAIAATVNGGSDFVPQDYYMNSVAPEQVQRLSDYTKAHENDLTAAQITFLSKAKTAVSTFDVSNFESLKNEAEGLFPPEEARFILTGKQATSMVPREEGSLLNGQSACTCSTASDFCENNTACKGGADGCGQVPGCGAFYGYICDGLCENP